jgi:hypothetical protein
VAKPPPGPTPPVPTAGPATVTTKHIAGPSPQCAIDIQWPIVDTGNAAINDAIAKAMPPGDDTALCSKLEPNETFEEHETFTVTMNRGGVLSITVNEDESDNTAAHPNGSVQTFSFDLATGRHLRAIEDVLTPQGVANVKQSCVAFLTAGDFGSLFTADEAAQTCAEAIAPDLGGPPAFAIEPTGFRLFIDGLPHAIEVVGLNGINTTWQVLTNQTLPVIAGVVPPPPQ